MNVKLFVFKSDGSSREIPLKSGQYLVGRGKEATLRIPLPSVSREHCLITVEDENLSVKDLGSSNGTYRNRQRVTEANLEPGDALGVGDITIVVQINGQPEPVPAPGSEASSDGSSLMETPPEPLKSPKPAPAPPKPKQEMPEPLADSDADTSSDLGTLPKGLGNDESSIFDFDFDFEDEDRPQL